MSLNHLLSPLGRLGQRGFLILAGGLLVAGLVVGMIPGIGALASLPLLWPWTCITVKRLHDLGHGGRVAVALNLLLGLMALIASASGMIGLAALPLLAVLTTLGLLMLPVSLACFLWLAFAPSQPRANRFGPPAPAFSLS